MKPTMDEVHANPIVAALNPYQHTFVKIQWLSPHLNPYHSSHRIKIGAAIAFMGGFPHIKVVAAYGMLMYDYTHGIYDGVSRLVIPSSGNTADGGALLAPAFGVPDVTIVMPSDAPSIKKNIISMIPWARLICPEGMSSVEDVALEEASRPGSLLLDQYKHPGNPKAHKDCTGPQLLDAAGDELGLVAIGKGSGGTIIGVSQFLKRIRRDITVLGVRPKRGKRVPGVRSADQMEIVTLPHEQASDAIVEVGRTESFLAARRLIREVQPRPGPSSGLAFAGLLQYLDENLEARERLRGRRAVFVCPDDARFYEAPTSAELDPDQGL